MSIDISKIFSRNLKELRNSEKFSIPELSQLLGLGISTFKKYEFTDVLPPFGTLQKIASTFQVSIDFLLFWNETTYPHNIKFLSLAMQIDKLDQNRRFQMESIVNSFLNINKRNVEQIKQDNFDIALTDNTNKNIEIMRKNFNLTQTDLAKKLNVTQSQIAQYGKNALPSIEKLMKLSEIFNISMHALITGQKLCFKFGDSHIEKAILQADQVLSLEEQKNLIYLMETIVKSASV